MIRVWVGDIWEQMVAAPPASSQKVRTVTVEVEIPEGDAARIAASLIDHVDRELRSTEEVPF